MKLNGGLPEKNWKQPLCCQNAYFQIIVSDLTRVYIIHIFLLFYLMCFEQRFSFSVGFSESERLLELCKVLNSLQMRSDWFSID